ncbi:MOSC domain-containing protein [Paenibacillus sp. YAF4_2]|uniref:MOSC domain-containing protein n=1 Tax=Paenibacillus sp. YAF4_2 TaxID=3233085 RepID=UPI003F9CD655
MQLGEISEIYRYPIKSFAGEKLEDCVIEEYGLQGDRFVTFYDETKKDWYKYMTARNIPNLLNYKAEFKDGDIQVTSPDGRVFGWDEALLEEIQNQTTTTLTMSKRKEPHPEAKHPHLLSVDGASILIITDSSLNKLQETWGKELDDRRFRANFVITVNDDTFTEGDWIGRKLSIGDTKLQVDSFCERCVLITMDPDTQVKDPTLLRKVNEEFNLHFGVYASVLQPGSVKLGDKVLLVE